MKNQTQIDHTNYPKSLVSKSYAELEFTMRDARGAMEAMPDGHKAGYYADEINYCSMEINSRHKAEMKSLQNHKA